MFYLLTYLLTYDYVIDTDLPSDRSQLSMQLALICHMLHSMQQLTLNALLFTYKTNDSRDVHYLLYTVITRYIECPLNLVIVGVSRQQAAIVDISSNAQSICVLQSLVAVTQFVRVR